MPLAPGTRLGPYEIVAAIGAGGMGEVYRARDSRLKRDVALKLLRADRGGDAAALLRRLEQEARTIAALNHPNLVAIHDIESHGGAPVLVMELLEGETLRARLALGPLPPRRALDLARQLAQGLAAAHAAGIVHRDLKPENIVVTPAGRLKILDFGLAKAADSATADQETLGATAAPVTSAGTVLGTVGYMAPEQVRGEPAGIPADIFAFGAILYEMLAGRRAFQAPTSVEAMTAILREEPLDLPGTLPLPPGLERIVRRCLEKAPPQRFQSAADLDFALAALADASSTSLGAAAAPPARRWSWRTPLAVAATAALTAAACALLMLDRGTPTIAPATLHPLALDANSDSGTANPVFWSPDGTALAYAAAPATGQPNQVFLYRASAGVPVQLTHVPVDANPIAWSRDGRDVYFITDRTAAAAVWSVAAVGGEPQAVLDFHHPAGGVQAVTVNGDALAALLPAPDGKLGVAYSQPLGAPLRWYQPHPFSTAAINDFPTLLFAPGGRQLLLSLPGTDGPIRTWLLPFPPDPTHPPRQVLANLPPHDYSPKFSWFSDGQRVLLTATVEAGGSGLWEANLDTGKLRLIAAHVAGGYVANLSPDERHLALARLRPDLDALSVDVRTGAITPVEDSTFNESMPAWASAAPALVYATDRDGADELWLRQESADGVTERPLITQDQLPSPGEFQLPALSPDAHRVVYTVLMTGVGSQPVLARLWMAAVAGGPPVPLTADAADYQVAPAWSPDGARIAFLEGAGTVFRLMVVATTGGATPRVLKASIGSGVLTDQAGPAWSHDGEWIAFGASDGLVHLIAPDGSSEHIAARTPLAVWTFSADSQSLYGITRHGATADLVAVALASGAVRVIGSLGTNLPQAVLQPGYSLSLTPDGKSLTYGAGKNRMELDLVAPFSPDGAGMSRLRHWLHLP